MREVVVSVAGIGETGAAASGSAPSRSDSVTEDASVSVPSRSGRSTTTPDAAASPSGDDVDAAASVTGSSTPTATRSPDGASGSRAGSAGLVASLAC
jgi:hypothetical protein